MGTIKGIVDNINTGFINGWCFDPENSDLPVVLELFVNGEKISEHVAEMYRKDILEKKIHPTGNVGFKFSIEELNLDYHSIIELKIKGSTKCLKSGKAFQTFKDVLQKNQNIEKRELCIVHIGMHKTGSSSVQHNLYKNREKNQNFSYFTLGENHSIPIFSLFSENPEKYYVHRRRGFDAKQVYEYNKTIDFKFRKHLIDNPNYNTFVISGEDINQLSIRSLQNMKKYLSGFFKEIKIFGYVRSPIDYINSAFQQVVKGGVADFSIVERMYPEYRKKLEKFDTVFEKENVSLHFFHKDHLVDHDVTVDFLAKNNLIVKDTFFHSVNESLSPEALSLLYVYRKYGPGYGMGVNSEKENIQLINALSALGSEKVRIGREIIFDIIDAKQGDIEWVEKRLGTNIVDKKGYSNTKTQISREEDLFDLAKRSTPQLKDLIEQKELMKEIKGETLSEIADLIHILRVQSAEKI